MGSLDSEQVSYARDVVERLWPPPAQVLLTSRRHPATPNTLEAQWLLLPNPKQPTLLVPTGMRAASRMLQRHGHRLLPRAVRRSLSWGVHTGLLDKLPLPSIQVRYPADTSRGTRSPVVTQLTEAIPEIALIGLILGTPRPNRKPVLQLFSAQGTTLGFVKVGIDDYTCQLVRTEAKNLSTVQKAGLHSVAAPGVLYLGTHEGLDLMALTPMESSQESRKATLPWKAMRELAHVSVTSPMPLLSSAYWNGLAVKVTEAGSRPGVAESSRIMQRIADQWGRCQLTFGSWHGDWAPWNMGYRGDVVQLWDWERFSSDVPIGFDAIHFQAQQVHHGRNDIREQEAVFAAEVPRLLELLGATHEPTLLLTLYLLEITLRFAGMTGEGESAQMHPRARWALEFAERVVAW